MLILCLIFFGGLKSPGRKKTPFVNHSLMKLLAQSAFPFRRRLVECPQLLHCRVQHASSIVRWIVMLVQGNMGCWHHSENIVKVDSATPKRGGSWEVRHLPFQVVYPPGNQHIPQKWHFEDDFPFPQVGYVNPLEGIGFIDVYYRLLGADVIVRCFLVDSCWEKTCEKQFFFGAEKWVTAIGVVFSHIFFIACGDYPF